VLGLIMPKGAQKIDRKIIFSERKKVPLSAALHISTMTEIMKNRVRASVPQRQQIYPRTLRTTRSPPPPVNETHGTSVAAQPEATDVGDTDTPPRCREYSE
jgi:hypothetical protein